MVRGVAAADIVPVTSTARQDPYLDDRERRGIIRRGSGKIKKEFLRPGPKAQSLKPLSEDIIGARRRCTPQFVESKG